jgi:hypothetical protein
MKHLLCFTFVIFILLILIFNPYTPLSLLHIARSSHRSKPEPEYPDLIITVKTTHSYHRTRIPHIVDTWFQLAPNDIYFISDSSDTELNQTVGGHLINSHCASGHRASALACKMNRELRVFIEKNAKWSCHFDDDNYVNVPLLKQELLKFDYNIPYYLGKTSTAEPMTVYEGSAGSKPFWFGTGGAGVCLSQAALQKATPRILNNGFRTLAGKFRLPDDVTLGFLMVNVLGIELTEMKNFHSHLETLYVIPVEELQNQPVLSGGTMQYENDNLVAIPYMFEPRQDPLKFRSLHCHLFPEKCEQQNHIL